MSRRVTDNPEEMETDISRVASSRRHSDNGLPYVHKVGVPPKPNLLKEITETVKETFFHDDPLRNFKDQSKTRKLVLGIQAVFPILDWGMSYNLSKFKGDLIAGLTIASLCIPQVNNKSFGVSSLSFFSLFSLYVNKFLSLQDIGYAKLANLDPQYGLCNSFFLHLYTHLNFFLFLIIMLSQLAFTYFVLPYLKKNHKVLKKDQIHCISLNLTPQSAIIYFNQLNKCIILIFLLT